MVGFITEIKIKGVFKGDGEERKVQLIGEMNAQVRVGPDEVDMVITNQDLSRKFRDFFEGMETDEED